MIRILHLITSLGTGGTEISLYRLLRSLDQKRFLSRVASLVPDGPMAERIRGLNIPVDDLNCPRGRPDPRTIFRLRRILAIFRPRVIMTWLYHADLLGLIATRKPMLPAGLPTPSLVWNLRCTVIGLVRRNPLTWLVRRVNAWCSSLPDLVLTNSTAGRSVHTALGYQPRRWETIPNGIDPEEFRPNPTAQKLLRTDLGFPPDTILVGLAGRYDPMKGHELFCSAASLATLEQPRLGFVCCGDGIAPDNTALMRYIEAAGIAHRTRLLGRIEDMPGFFTGLDIACLASIGEGFPNVLAEAMACSVPCVATDAGDASAILGNTGRLVPVADPPALGQALAELAGLPAKKRRTLGRAARERIIEYYAQDTMLRHYEAMLDTLTNRTTLTLL
ncbi:Glycosyl transferase group 1 [Desulfovibrionales bacterium]